MAGIKCCDVCGWAGEDCVCPAVASACSTEPEIFSGQLWGQPSFPYCRRCVMMLGGPGPVKMCLISGNDMDVPNVFHDVEGGKWEFTPEELLEHLRSRKYEPIGRMRMETVGYANEAELLEIAKRTVMAIRELKIIQQRGNEPSAEECTMALGAVFHLGNELESVLRGEIAATN